MSKGLFFVIEGSDGSGKTTQIQLLAERLKNAGHTVSLFDFPRYDEPSSYFIKQYLNGHYGTSEEVGPYTASLFFALDRYEAAPQIREALERGDIVLCDRYTGSNMAHQGTKFSAPEERRGYFIWADSIEFQMLGIPRPNCNIVLRVRPEISQRLMEQRGARSYTDKQKDIHEADIEHLRRAYNVYADLCQLFPKDFTSIECSTHEELLSITSIHDSLWQTISPLLSTASAQQTGTIRSYQKASHSNNPTSELITKNSSGDLEITKAGKVRLNEVLSNPQGSVYAFNSHINPLTVAAAMARLSRRGDDLRITLLDEFMKAGNKDDELLRRVITAYGDDSVQQLTGIHLVVENASNILTKKIERGRIAAYLEQSTRYIYFDKKDTEGRYKFYTPKTLTDDLKTKYDLVLTQIFELYSAMVRELTIYVEKHSEVPKDEQDAAWRSACRAQACDAVRNTLPVATTATVGIFASGQALEGLIMRLLSDELEEARETGLKILHEARKVIPAFLERADKPERGGATIAYRAKTHMTMEALAQEHLPRLTNPKRDPVTLTDYFPKNELTILPDMLYEHSNLPLQDIQEVISTWSYKQKSVAFDTYMGERFNRRHKPGRALERVHYSFDIVCDYGIFRDLQRHRMVDDLAWQNLTPHLGYQVPEIVSRAGLDQQFHACFVLSQKLYDELIAAGYRNEAQYAVLLGHKMRWKVTYNAREAFHIHELRTTPQGHPDYRALVKQMHDKVAEVHPLIAGAMKFVNKDEDPELTRLAAERYSQYKLKMLNQSDHH